MRIVLLGAPGAGKGTQAERLADKFGIPTISTGDIFRSNVQKNTELGKEVKSYIEAGNLVPDELVNRLVMKRLEEDDCKNGFIFDGYPRTIPQAKAFATELEKIGQKLEYAINVHVPDEEIIDRMTGRRVCSECGETYHTKYNPPKKEDTCDTCGGALMQRKDDASEIVINRLEHYHEDTAPIIDFYEKQGILVTVDGTKDIKEVFKDIEKAIEAE